MKAKYAAGLVVLAMLLAVLTGCGAVSDGWQDRDDGRYYFQQGQPCTGWQVIDGSTYHFQENGVMATGHLEIDGEAYYFDETGIMATGWQLLEGKYCFFRETGSRVTGWLSLNGVRHYLDSEGCAVSGPAEVDGALYLFDEKGALSTGWVTVNGRRYYGDSACRPVSGWQEIDGIRYCFASDYSQKTGWMEDGGFSRYFYADGSPARGRVRIDEKEYTFAFNGQLVLLVNPWNLLPEDYTVELQGIGNKQQVASYAVSDFHRMMEDCRNAGFHPVVCSSYRTQAYQEGLYRRRIERYMDEGLTEEEATERAGKSVAIPGTSEHQLGLALDIIDNSNWNLDETQADMPTQKWLMEHSWEYGWILRYPNEKSEVTGIIYEPWHYRYVGIAVAADVHETGLCLEEYLQHLSDCVG